jgi:class 3 adenylate cyclase
MLRRMSTDAPDAEHRQLQAAIAALEAQRSALGDATVEALLAPARARLAALKATAEPAQVLRQVSILFLDVVGSTALSTRLSPEAISAIMDGALARGTALVQAHGGRVLQYAGDNLLAAFGADAVAEDDAERAVRCGLALAALGTELGREVQAVHGHEGVNVRVGIHSGSVLLGGGVDAAGTIRGMAVNVAARMEQSAPPGSVRVSIDTWRMVQGLFEGDEQPALQVKGVDTPLRTCLVRGERASRGHRASRGVDGLATPLVGREAERAQLQATVLGEAGLGKSRLLQAFVSELRARADGAAEFEVLQASGHLQGQNLAFGLLRELLFDSTGVQDSDSQE